MVIQADDEIRLKIVGTRVDATGIVSIKLTMKIILFYFTVLFINLYIKLLIFQFAIGTLMDDYLGNGMFSITVYNAFKYIYNLFLLFPGLVCN